MIQFTLKCADGHAFDSWFQSSSAFEKLQAAGMVSCGVCGSSEVSKSIMAPRVSTARGKVTEPEKTRPLSQAVSQEERQMAELRHKIESNSEYVGQKFAAEARAMHDGDTPNRAIYGEAKPADAKKLLEDGVPVVPLPFVPARKTN